MIISAKANVPVTTLTEDCWKTCDYFDVDTTGVYANGSKYVTVCVCKNLDLCQHATVAFIKDEEENNVDNQTEL